MEKTEYTEYTKKQILPFRVFFWFSRFCNYAEYSLFNSLHSKNLSIIELKFNKDLAYLALALETEFKGYKILKRKNLRYKIYSNIDFLTQDFLQFSADSNKENIFDCINNYFSKRLNYTYLEGSSFFNLLKNAQDLVLKGDCNQVVTLYLYLYSLKYDLKKVQLLKTKDHVAIYYNKKVIEATNQSVKSVLDYKNPELISSKEILTINLLDVHDLREEVLEIRARHLYEAFKLAKKISPNDKIIYKNYQIALHNLSLEFIKQNKFKEALTFARRIQDSSVIENYLSERAVKYYLNKKLIAKAYFWAEKILDFKNKNEYLKLIANRFFEEGKYSKSEKIFKKIKDKNGIKKIKNRELNILIEKFNKEQNQSAKLNKNLIRKIINLAKKVDNDDLAKKLSDFL